MSAIKKKIFISHISDESKIAIQLKEFLKVSFQNQIDVFVSSDYESIQSGEEWYPRIVGSIKDSDATIVLLSKQSSLSPWLYFEPGISVGANKITIPIVFRGLLKGVVPQPLASLHIRNLHEPEEVKAANKEIANKLELSLSEMNYQNFVNEIKLTEKILPYKGLYLKPYVDREANSVTVRFQIINSGNLDMELLAVEASIPESALKDRLSAIPNLFDTFTNTFENIRYYHCSHKVYGGYVPPGHEPAERLPDCITPGLSPYKLKTLRFPVNVNLSTELLELSIHSMVHAKNFPSETHTITLKELLESGK